MTGVQTCALPIYHVHDLGRGHAQAAAELGLDAEAPEHLVDLGADRRK